ncbi:MULTISPECIES: cytochrome P460 family protein [Methylomonas]|uniref:Cytochrome C n=1 Tax=Methylomonas koyamae TaxID=702114 RepID=A0A177MWW5_9GAMM|nr:MULTISPECIES: cytochrome P460 family protein [Methylomonas]ANE54815.1 cytochrome C [Methylomonas sp. DH-1]OAI10121.1 cytochrome C [Methylomonas koyamae]WNB74789.1 cytochrome P460 family protein [Methylomonas koyamae]BBL59506.1 cytochrome c [Methylomonas koyamae]
MNMRLSLSAAGLFLTLFASAQAAEHSVAYPEGYRTWLHAKSMLIQPGHALENPFQGLHHVYANKKAESGLKSGKYEDGSVLVFDLLQYQEKDKTIQEGERKLVGVMQKDSKKYAATGGWGFEGFAGNSKTERLVKDGGASCFACHASEQKTDYVFSQYRP